ncbi:hypothetical protein DFS34DRAFT_637422 [Phlyctochytrium arcticum]|nr:hypothetical protein DFS34DRAFT_637422 [Phlyctochytrium arcticum]
MAVATPSLMKEFTPAELETIPACFAKAAERAQHSEFVRKQLSTLSKEKSSFPTGLDTAGVAVPRRMLRKKFWKMLTHSGYQQLTLKPLAAVEKSLPSRSKTAAYLGDSTGPTRGMNNSGNTVNDQLKSVVAELEELPWLDLQARQSFANIFIVELAARYNQVCDFISTRLLPNKNRLVISIIIERIRGIRNEILECCRRKKQKMENADIFGNDMNIGRLATFFKCELYRRIDTQRILTEAIAEAHSGYTLHPSGITRPGDPLRLELQEIRDGLEHVFHPTPKLEAPVISKKHEAELIRRSMRRSSSNANSDAELTEIQRILSVSQRRSSVLAFRRRTQSRGKSATATKSETRDDFDSAIQQHQAGKTQLWNTLTDEDITIADDFSRLADDFKDTVALNLMRGDNPLLQMHAGLCVYRRRTAVEQTIAPPRHRYLPPSSYRQRQLIDFDYDLCDKVPLPLSPSPESKTSQEFELCSGDQNKAMKPLGSQVSSRIPKGFITLATEPAAAVSEFGSDMDNSMLNSIDEKLTRYKEVEELYDEIMKTMNKTHLDPDEIEDSDSAACPAAPLDGDGPPGFQWRGRIDPALVRPLYHAKREKSTSVVVTPPQLSSLPSSAGHGRIRLKTRDATETGRQSIVADEYIRNRKVAMRKTLSSKYDGTFQYNFGGYIPFDVERRKKQAAQTDISFPDYLDYLATLKTDFAFNLLYHEDERSEALRKAQEEAEAAAKAEEERKRVENERRERAEQRRQMLSYTPGEWNPKIMDFMEELNHAQTGDHGNLVSARPNETRDSEAHSQLDAAASPSQQRASSARPDSVDIRQMQQELEALWTALKMPSDQKLDMAIKYGGHRFAPKLETAINLWKTASEHIFRREEVLQEIEIFEQTASDPQRFFRKGFEGSSEARLKEADEREELMRRLHFAEARITDVTSRIKNELHESVTFKGASYREKMRTDYPAMIKRLQRERKERRALQTPSGISEATSAIMKNSPHT